MTGNEIVVQAKREVAQFQPESFEAMLKMAETLCKSQLVPKAVQQKPQDALVILLTGRELGFAPMQSLRMINVIDGKGVLSADAMQALCLSRPDVCEYFATKESTAKKAVVVVKRRGDPQEREFTFTIEDATRAQLTHKENWKKYPASMLMARCKSVAARAMFADLCAGLYDPDEADEFRGRSAAPSQPTTTTTTATTGPPRNLNEATQQLRGQSAVTVIDVKPEPEQEPLKEEVETKPDHQQSAATLFEDPTEILDERRAADPEKRPLPKVETHTKSDGTKHTVITNLDELYTKTTDVGGDGEVVEKEMLLFVPFGSICGKSLSSFDDAKLIEMRNWAQERVSEGKLGKRDREFRAFVEGCDFELTFRASQAGQ